MPEVALNEPRLIDPLLPTSRVTPEIAVGRASKIKPLMVTGASTVVTISELLVNKAFAALNTTVSAKPGVLKVFTNPSESAVQLTKVSPTEVHEASCPPLQYSN